MFNTCFILKDALLGPRPQGIFSHSVEWRHLTIRDGLIKVFDPQSLFSQMRILISCLRFSADRWYAAAQVLSVLSSSQPLEWYFIFSIITLISGAQY